jgi:hypothetical protein
MMGNEVPAWLKCMEWTDKEINPPLNLCELDEDDERGFVGCFIVPSSLSLAAEVRVRERESYDVTL